MKIRICKSCGEITEIDGKGKPSYIKGGLCTGCADMKLIKALETFTDKFPHYIPTGVDHVS
jgi:hypothetical protein